MPIRRTLSAYDMRAWRARRKAEVRERTAQHSSATGRLAASGDDPSRWGSCLDVPDSRRTPVLEDMFNEGGLGNGGASRLTAEGTSRNASAVCQCTSQRIADTYECHTAVGGRHASIECTATLSFDCQPIDYVHTLLPAWNTHHRR